MNEPDEQLLRRAKTGDSAALGELLMRFGPRIRMELDINPKWQSVLEVDDVLQVTYFEAFEQIGRFAGDVPAFSRWLRRIAENNLKDAIHWLHREKRPQPEHRVTPSDDEDSLVWLCQRLTGGVESPSRHAVGNEVRQLLEAEISNLPSDYRDVLRWIYLEGKTVGEVAQRIGRTKGAVHLLRIRAVDRLRERLGSGSAFLSYHA